VERVNFKTDIQKRSGTQEGVDMTHTLIRETALLEEAVEVWIPHSRCENEAEEMVNLLRSLDLDINIVRIRDLYQPELHVGVEEYVGVQGVKRYLQSRL
jgi:hypothetical protein